VGTKSNTLNSQKSSHKILQFHRALYKRRRRTEEEEYSHQLLRKKNALLHFARTKVVRSEMCIRCRRYPFYVVVLLVCVRARLFCLKMKKNIPFWFWLLFCERQIRVLKNRDSSSQKQTMRCVDFHNIFQQDVLLIVLNVLPRFETNYSEKNQKQTRCVDFHKIFQDTTTDYCAECSSALRNK